MDDISASHHIEQPQGVRLARLAVSATLHCLTGCAIGEVLGLVLATWWGLANASCIVLAVVLAFVFGYGLTIAPVLRSGLPLRRALAVAFVVTVPVNRALLARGKGRAVVHAYHH